MAAETEIDRLVVRLLGDTSGYTKALDGAVKTTRTKMAQVTEAAKGQRALDKLAAEGAALTSAMRTPFERYAQGLSQVNKLLKAGAISQETYTRAVQKLTDASPAGRAAVVAQAQAAKLAREAEAKRNQVMAAGNALTQSMRTPQERYAQELRRIQQLYSAGAISQETYNRATKQVHASISALNPVTETFIQKLRRIGASLPSIGGALNQVGTKLQSLGGYVVGFGGVLSGLLTAPLVALGYKAYGAAVTMDTLERSLSSVTGSAEETAAQLKRLEEIAKLPGIGLEEAIQGSVMFQAAGISAEQAEAAIKGVGNALATVGKGKFHLELVNAQLTQLATSEFPQGDEIRILSEHMPQLRKIMNEAFGTSRGEELKKMGVSGREAFAAIVTGLNNLASVRGGPQVMMENLEASIRKTLASIGKVILAEVGPAIEWFSDKVAKLGKWFDNMAPAQKRFIVYIGAAVATVGPLVAGLGGLIIALGTFAVGLGGIFSLSVPVLIALAAAVPVIAALGAGLVAAGMWAFEFIKKSYGLADIWELWENVSESVRGFTEKAQGFLANFQDNVQRIIAWVRRNWTPLMDDLKNLFSSFVSSTTHNFWVVVETGQRLFALFLGWLTKEVTRIFEVDFPAAVMRGLSNAMMALQKHRGIVIEALKSIWNGTNFDFRGFAGLLASEFSKGIVTEDILGDMGKVLKEGAAKLESPIAGFKSSLEEGLKLNFELPAEEEVKETVEKLDVVQRKFAETQKKAKEKVQVGIEWERNDIVRKGSDEMGRMLAAVQQRLDMAKPKFDNVWTGESKMEGWDEGRGFHETSLNRARAGRAAWDADMETERDAAEWEVAMKRGLDGSLPAAHLAKIEEYLRSLVEQGKDKTADGELIVKPINFN